MAAEGLKVPGRYTNGIKVHLDRSIELAAAGLATILVDLDLEEDFAVQGSGMAPVIKSVSFTPTLKEKGRFQQQG